MNLQIAVVTSLLLFAIGVYGVCAKRDILRILISVAIMLNSITVLIVALGKTQSSAAALNMAHSFVLFVWAVEVLEIIVALAIFLYLSRHNFIDVTKLQEFKW